jgi:hypothetical protein
MDIQMDDVEIHFAFGFRIGGFVYFRFECDRIVSVLCVYVCLAGMGLARDCILAGLCHRRTSY